MSCIIYLTKTAMYVSNDQNKGFATPIRSRAKRFRNEYEAVGWAVVEGGFTCTEYYEVQEA